MKHRRKKVKPVTETSRCLWTRPIPARIFDAVLGLLLNQAKPKALYAAALQRSALGFFLC